MLIPIGFPYPFPPLSVSPTVNTIHRQCIDKTSTTVSSNEGEVSSLRCHQLLALIHLLMSLVKPHCVLTTICPDHIQPNSITASKTVTIQVNGDSLHLLLP